METRNLTLLTDLYQLTMMNGYLKYGKCEEVAVFDVFFRQNDMITYSLACGLEQVVDYVLNLRFEEEEIKYLKSLNIFDDNFLEYLKGFKFSGVIYAVPEGTVVFPGEPIMTVKAPIIEAQLVETAILNMMNFQTLIATKSAKICYAAKGDTVMEFGLRRAQAPDAGIYGARAAVIGGCNSTSNVLAGKMFDIPVAGTHAHSWVMNFKDEYTAFMEYAKTYPDNTLLLVDTYDTLNQGIPNAIKVFNHLKSTGHKPKGIRLDSGDLAYLSKKARVMLDEAGYPDTKICASGDLDEHLVVSLKNQGAKIDSFGVGERLITAKSNPVFGGVYKLVAKEEGGEIVPKIKISENPEKITNPHFKKIYRIYDKETGKASADLLCVWDETVDESKPLEIFDPIQTWKKKEFTNYYLRELLMPIFKNGECVYSSPRISDIREYCLREVDTLWDEVKRFENPHNYYVDLSEKLWNIKRELLVNKGERQKS